MTRRTRTEIAHAATVLLEALQDWAAEDAPEAPVRSSRKRPRNAAPPSETAVALARRTLRRLRAAS